MFLNHSILAQQLILLLSKESKHLDEQLSKQLPKTCCVVPSSQESMDNSLSLFDYGLDNPYDDLIDDFDPYLEYGERYQNRTAFKDAFYG